MHETLVSATFHESTRGNPDSASSRQEVRFRYRGMLSLGFLAVMASISHVTLANQLRPPAVPLITNDPYFSIWSPGDHLAESDTIHWSGAGQRLESLVRIDGNSYRLMGKRPAGLPALPQVGLNVKATRSIYDFEGQGLHITLTFMTPLLPADLEVLSRPVTYLTWAAYSVDHKPHQVSIYYDNTAELVVNTVDEPVIWSTPQVEGMIVERMGTQAQAVLGKSGDDLRIDWGYLYLAAGKDKGTVENVNDESISSQRFIATGSIAGPGDPALPRTPSDRMPVMAITFQLDKVVDTAVERHILLAYDDGYSVELLHHRLRPYWRRNGDQAAELLKKASADYVSIEKRCAQFDAEVEQDMTAMGGPNYASLGGLTFREALAGNKLVADVDGKPLFFPKENFSDGSIGTPDVIYPEAPILLLFNPQLLRASLEPVFQYASSAQWRFSFAPAQLGTYPLANGQTYGGGEASEDSQQPVEESADMLILTEALVRLGQAGDIPDRYWPVLTRWAQYLRGEGFDPKMQLCTDDFAGPMAHNTNLSLKGIEGLAAYGFLAGKRGDASTAAEYSRMAADYAARWVTAAGDGDHFRLAFDQPNTWSQKYNLIWNELWGLNMFPPDVAGEETKYYLAKSLPFGFPLDSRHAYTKLDWEAWSASLTGSRGDFDALMAPVYNYVNQTPVPIPLSDWYDAADGKPITYRNHLGKEISFRARPVVGGIFMRMLCDPALWNKWASRASKS